MNFKKWRLKSKLKSLGGLLIGVWIIGAFISGLNGYFDLKKDCIEDKGFWKGLLWCSEETKYSMGNSMIRELGWPFRLVYSNVKLQKQVKVNEEQISGLYICWALAEKLEKKNEADLFYNFIRSLRKEVPTVDDNHDKYVVLASDKMKLLSDIESTDFAYSLCKEPLINIISYEADKMIQQL